MAPSPCEQPEIDRHDVSQLTASDINFAIVRPLVSKYARLRNPSVVYACLTVRAHFLGASDDDLAHQNLMDSRAMMSELLAIKLSRSFAKYQLELAAVLVTAWNPLLGAPKEAVDKVLATLGGDEKDLNNPRSALEVRAFRVFFFVLIADAILDSGDVDCC